MNKYNGSYYEPAGMVLMPLAWTKNTSDVNAFWPSLATKWSLSRDGRSLTVWLRTDAKWSNGKPVTAEDVKTTFAALAATGQDSYELQAIKIVNPHEVIFKRDPAPFNLFENQILQQVITPAQVYGEFLPSDTWTLIAESQYLGANQKLQTLATQASKKLTAIGAKLQAYNPSTKLGRISDGPFVVTGVNTGQETATKNPLYWDANKIKVQNAVLYNYTGGPNTFALMTSGKTDEATSGMPLNVEKAASRTPGNQFFAIPEYSFSGLLFNEKSYPYNIVQVRQALAYVINRQFTSKIEMPYTPSKDIPMVTGLGNGVLQSYLSASQLKQLNPYNYNPKKATSLLESVGFKKGSNGQWLLPNGQPWKITLYDCAGDADWNVGGSYIANALTSFGIPTIHDVVNATAWAHNQALGDYPISFYWDNGGPNGYLGYSSIYGAADGYSQVNGTLKHTSSVQQGNYIQTPVTLNVKGVGKINPGELTLQLVQTSDKNKVKEDVYKLARAFNQTVPMIPTEDEMVNGFVNDLYYTDYPTNDSLVLDSQYYFAPFEWMDLGYVHSKS
jgi:peptide/nickel transport system substrate-binding protein